MATMAEAFKMQTTDQPSTEGLRWKTRIAVLWLIYMGNFAAYCIGIASGQVSRAEAVTNANMITLAVFFLVPSILAWLSLTLKDAANRWMNFVFGILFSIPITSFTRRRACIQEGDGFVYVKKNPDSLRAPGR